MKKSLIQIYGINVIITLLTWLFISPPFIYQLKFEAENIFHNHLAPNAPMPVNIDSNAVKDAEEQLQNPNSDMFRLQQQQVWKKKILFS